MIEITDVESAMVYAELADLYVGLVMKTLPIPIFPGDPAMICMCILRNEVLRLRAEIEKQANKNVIAEKLDKENQ